MPRLIIAYKTKSVVSLSCKLPGMIKKTIFLVIPLLMAGFCSPCPAQEINVITYNIRFDNPDDGENRWDARKENLTQLLVTCNPDIFGIQEGLVHQVKFMDSLLNEFNYIGYGRDDGMEAGEFCAIFYKNARFLLLQQGLFWLSETPGVPSRGWDAALNRICVYGLFESLNSRHRFMVFNTHLDHMGVIAREKSVGLILEKTNELNPEHLPVIVLGDFNLESGDHALIPLMNEFMDSRAACTGEISGPAGTFNDFRFDLPVIKRIDYIFLSKGKSEVKLYRVIADANDGLYPSDHFPVFATVRLREGN
jgi:endonuclease/exonuclease/phosphatase family metal-dependent hydrolase